MIYSYNYNMYDYLGVRFLLKFWLPQYLHMYEFYIVCILSIKTIIIYLRNGD